MIPLKDNVGADGMPVVTIAVIALLALVFLWQLTLSGAEGSAGDRNGKVVTGDLSERDELAVTYGTSPARVSEHIRDDQLDNQPPWWLSPFTAVPVAADFLHLAVNLLFLLIFGRTLEARLGRARFLVLLGLAAVAGVAAQALVDPGAAELIVGSSTALAGVIGAYLVLHPRAAVVTLSVIPLLGTVLEVPVLLVAGAWLAIGLIPAVGPLVDPDLLAGIGLQYAGFAGALLAGALIAPLLGLGRPSPGATPASA